MTGNAEHNFDPNWPHGHLYVDVDGLLWPAKIVARLGGTCRPILAVVTGCDGRDAPETFSEGGLQTSVRHRFCLINAPAPEPTVVRVEKRGA